MRLVDFNVGGILRLLRFAARKLVSKNVLRIRQQLPAVGEKHCEQATKRERDEKEWVEGGG